MPPVPKKNKSSSTAGGLFSGGEDSDADSASSASTQRTGVPVSSGEPSKLSIKDAFSHRRTGSAASSLRASPRPSMDDRPMSPFSPMSPRKNDDVVLYREGQRISLRAFLRSLLQNPQIAQTKAMQDFLVRDPVTLRDEDHVDIMRRKSVDEKRVEEQKKFYEIARKRAAELDIYMEQ